MEAAGGRLIGHWSAADCTFHRSRALRGDRFVGLALDYENQADFNELRIVLWTEQLVRELSLQPVSGPRCDDAVQPRDFIPCEERGKRGPNDPDCGGMRGAG